MNLKVTVASVFLFIALKINSVTCLQCHVCNSINDSGCLEVGKNTKFLQTCSSPSDVSCRIQEQWVDFDVLGQQSSMRVVRQCATNAYDADRPCYYRTGFGGRTNVCNCQGDGCNEAPRTTASLLMLVALMGLYLVKKFL